MKVIINNESTLTDSMSLDLVASVIRMGRISDNKKSYCAATTFGSGFIVVAKRNKKSDSFRVMNSPKMRERV